MLKYVLISQDFHHHHPATPLEQVGPWMVYSPADVQVGWPHNGHHLALACTEAQLDKLRDTAKPRPVVVRDLPEPPDEE
jgi:hypothetical protein